MEESPNARAAKLGGENVAKGKSEILHCLLNLKQIHLSHELMRREHELAFGTGNLACVHCGMNFKLNLRKRAPSHPLARIAKVKAYIFRHMLALV
jgi:hypothetical protein